MATTGCSITWCTHSINNFEPETYMASHIHMLTGISQYWLEHCQLWFCPDTNGQSVMLYLHAVHVPDVIMYLLLPQQIMADTQMLTKFILSGNKLVWFLCLIPVWSIFCMMRLNLCQFWQPHLAINIFLPFVLRLAHLTLAPIIWNPFTPHLFEHLGLPFNEGISTVPEFTDTTCIMATQQCLFCAHHHFCHVGFCNIQIWAQRKIQSFEIACSLSSSNLSCLSIWTSLQKDSAANGGLTDWADTLDALVSVDHMVSGTGGQIPFHVSQPSPLQYKYCSLWTKHYSMIFYNMLTPERLSNLKGPSKPLPLAIMYKWSVFTLTMAFLPLLSHPTSWC